MSTKNKKRKFSWLLAGGITIIGCIKYQSFIFFINNLKISLKVVETNDSIATIYISALNVFRVPYSIQKIHLINEKMVIGTVSNIQNINDHIVKNSQIPISLDLNNSSYRELIENCDVIIKYSFYGLTFERLYKPTIQKEEITIFQKGESQAQTISKTIEVKKCCCKK